MNRRCLPALAPLLALALLLVSAAAHALPSEDAARPTPFVGAGVDFPNDGRSHVFYYRLATRHVRPPHQRAVTLRVFTQGRGAVRADLLDASLGRTFVSCENVDGTPPWREATSTNGVSIVPVLRITVAAGVTRWSVMVRDFSQAVAQRVHRPGGSPSPSPTPAPSPEASIPVAPGGAAVSPWPAGGLSEAVPEGYRPIYFWRDLTGGALTVDMSITTPYSATVTFEVMARDAPPEATYAIWTASHTGHGAADGSAVTQSWTDTSGSLPAGRYLIRVTRESASRQSAYTLRVR